MILFLVISCIQDISSPYLGDCAEYPNGRYDYGQIGIGDCISGPTEMAFLEDDNGDWHLLLTNANSYLNFDGGSLMSIPYDNIDLEVGQNIISDLSPTTLPLPNFSGPISFAKDNSLALVGVRYSEDARTREAEDKVHLFDVQNPASPVPANVGQNNQNTITVKADPVDIVTSSLSGLAFVANRTSHDISVLDTNGETIKVIKPWPVSALSDASFETEDPSSHSAELHLLRQLTQDDYADPTTEVATLTDDEWALRWIEGTWRIWLPEDTGWQRYDTNGDQEYRPSAFGNILSNEDRYIETPFYFDGTVLYSSDGDLYSAVWDASEQTWQNSSFPLLQFNDADCSSPSFGVDDVSLFLFYACQTDDNWSFHRSEYVDGVISQNQSTIYSLEDEPNYERISEPFVVYEPTMLQWRMYYSAYDGDSWAIRQATSIDLENWTANELVSFADPDFDYAAPVVSEESDRYRMWYAVGQNLVWDIAYAESVDGENWVDYGVIFDLNWESVEPPRIPMQAYPTSAFRLEGEQAGVQSGLIEVGLPYISERYGWLMTPVAGYWMGSNSYGADSAYGVQLDSILSERGLAFTTITDESSINRIAVASIFSDGTLVGITPIISPDATGFDAENVSHPVVFDNGEELIMLYAGEANGQSNIGLASSQNGFQWEREGVVLRIQGEWESVSVIPSSVESTSSGFQLWYSGFDGSSWRVGTASSSDGKSWTRNSDIPIFSLGKAGDWDDSGVKDPVVVPGSENTAIWYSGFDGQRWQIGYAVKDGSEWVRSTDINDTARPIMTNQGLFHITNVRRPVPHTINGLLRLYYSGDMGSVSRVGVATGTKPDRLRPIYKSPNLGDSLLFETQKGDKSISAIPLDTQTEEVAVTGLGLTALYIDEERGFLFVASKLLPYIIVIDIRDDSDDREDFVDRNYLDIESIIGIQTSSGAAGYRQFITQPGSDILYALNDSPEAVWMIDISTVEDNAYSELIQEIQYGYLPATSGDEQEVGADTRMFIGPGQMVLHPDGKRLFVSNFNANSISVYDLTLGPYGKLIAELPHSGENPYAMALSPDSNQLVIANYTGNVSNSNLSESTLTILDIDTESDSYLQFLTWVMNQ
jgi:predicted GH43/DUF377 family glycosyl hydrolase